MKKEEFFNKWTEEDLICAHVVIGKPTYNDFTYYFYEENNEWIVAYYGERGDFGIYFRGDEEAAYDELDAFATVEFDQYKEMMGIK